MPRPSADNDLEAQVQEELLLDRALMDEKYRRAQGCADRVAEDAENEHAEAHRRIYAAMNAALQADLKGGIRPQAPMDQPRRRMPLPESEDDDGAGPSPLLVGFCILLMVALGLSLLLQRLLT